MSAKKKSTAKKYTAIPQTMTAPAPSKVSKEQPAVVAPASPAAAAVMEAPKAAVAVESKHVAASVAAASEPTKTVDLTEWTTQLNGSCADAARDAAAALVAGGAKAVDVLSAVVINETGYYNSIVRAAAAASLGQVGDSRAVPALLVGVRDSMAEASAEAVRALVKIGDRRAIAALVDVVGNADGYYLPVVRLAAIVGLKHLGGPEATAALAVVAANTNEEASIRQAVAA